MLNSYEDNLVAKFVRELARPVAGLNNDYHELFTIHYTKKGAKVQDYWSSPSKRLRDDEFISRLLTMLTKKPLAPRGLTSSNQEMESMYVKLGDPITGEWALDPKLAKTHKNAVIEALDFILNYATTRFQISNLKMGIQEFTVISRLYVYFVKTFGRQGFRIDNWDKFYLAVRNSMDILSIRTDITPDNKGDRTVCEAFSQYLTVHNDSMKCTKSIEWLLEGIDIEDCGFVDLDKIRGYTKEQLDIGLRSQGNVDWIWSEPLNIKDAAGGHIVPHCDGGKTVMSNLCVIRKEDNQRMGSMNAHLYKAMVLAELEKAV
jgi:hypothetical protein